MSAIAAAGTVSVIHGPNLNLLGRREPEIYGGTTLEQVDEGLRALGAELDLQVRTYQSNHEGALVDRVQQDLLDCRGIIINPAAYTHTSIALRDALLAAQVPVIEIHISNIHRREAFRRRSMLADIVTGQVCGLGVEGYYLALRAMARLLA